MKLSRYIYLLFVGIALAIFFPNQVYAEEGRCEGPGFNIRYNPQIILVSPVVPNTPIVMPNPITFNFRITTESTFTKMKDKYVRLKFGLPGPGLSTPLCDASLNVYCSPPVQVTSDVFNIPIIPSIQPNSFNLWLFQPGAGGSVHSGSLQISAPINTPIVPTLYNEFCSHIDYVLATDPSQVKNLTSQLQHSSSAGQGCSIQGNDGVLTAIGCIPYNTTALVNALVVFASLAGGGIALLLMAFSAIQMIAQGSDPKVLQEAQQRFVAAIAGLLFIIFAVLILRIIGVDILQIPGFGR